MLRMIVGAALMAAGAQAQTPESICGETSHDAVRMVQWSIDHAEARPVIRIELSNETGRGFRMIDGRSYFLDVLGQLIASTKAPRDIAVAAGAIFTVSQTLWEDGPFDRLPDLYPDDVVTAFCTSAIVFDDGEAVRY